jgi:sortase A
MLHRSLGARLALNRFDAGAAETPRSGSKQPVDFSLWSEKRVKGYLDSLSLLNGDPMAVLAIERLHVHAPVFPGTDELVLNRGLGWIAGTAKPGESGNSGIAGHRDGFFRSLKDVAVGDSMELKTTNARFLYRVDEIEIVSPKDVGVLRPRGAASLTLVTCFPFYHVGDAPKRFIVHAELVQGIAKNSARESGSRDFEAAKAHK